MSARHALEGVDICGVSWVARMCIRRRLRSGRNFDLVTICDLAEVEVCNACPNCSNKCKTLIVVMAPPCTAMGSWHSANRQNDLELIADTFGIGMRIVEMCVKVARIQLEGNRQSEDNPAGRK